MNDTEGSAGMNVGDRITMQVSLHGWRYWLARLRGKSTIRTKLYECTAVGKPTPETPLPTDATEKYEDLGGVYFPILQQDGSRVLIKIGSGKDAGHIKLLEWLRQHDRMPGKVLS